MTAIPQHEPALKLPSALRSLLGQIAMRQWWVESLVGLLKMLTLALSAWLAGALVLGYASNLWMSVRLVVAAVVWAAVTRSLPLLIRPMLRIPNLAGAARQAESIRPELQERLSSAVELVRERNTPFTGSAALVRHLIEQAYRASALVQVRQAVPIDAVFRWIVCLTPVLLAWVLLALLSATGTQTWAGAYRVLFPWRSELPAALSIVRVQPGNVTLAEGDPLDITAQIAGHAEEGRVTLVRRLPNHQERLDELEQVAPTDYRIHLDSIREGFAYKITCAAGESPWFKAAVHPVSTIMALSVRYDFPSYTGLGSKTVALSDGNVDAPVGTKITLAIHTSSPALPASSRLRLEPDKAEPKDMALAPLSDPNTYQTQFTIQQNGHYTIQLTNQYGLTNRNERPRRIIARPDELPVISIQSPPAETSVRPDDVVPIRFAASDDFGLSRIEALVQVDEGPVRSEPVRFDRSDPRHVSGPDYLLSVQDVLDAAKESDAKRINVHLKATDNRDPDPQFSLSNQLILNINRGQWQSLQGEQEQREAQRLEDSIRRAMNELDQNKSRLEQVKSPNVREDPAEQAEMERQAQEDAAMRQRLADAKDQAFFRWHPEKWRRNDLEDQPGASPERIRKAAEGKLHSPADDEHEHRLKASAVNGTTEARQAAAAQAHAPAPHVNEPLEEWQQKALDQAAKELPQTSRDLSKAADAVSDSVFAKTAFEVKEIAQGPIENAAEEATRADLNPDDATDRTRSAIRSIHHITEARQALQKLLDRRELDRTQHDAEAARNLADAARQQAQASELMQPRERAENDEQSRAQQRRAMDKQQLANQRLQQAIGQSEMLRDDQARQIAQRLQELTRKVAETSHRQAGEQARDKKQKRPPDQVAEAQKEIARQSAEARQQARNLQGQARNSKDMDVRRRAEAAEKDLSDAEQHAQAAAQASKEPAKAKNEQAGTAEALARAEADLRGSASNEAAAKEKADDPRLAAQRVQEAAEAQQEASQQNPAAAAQAARAANEAAQAMAREVPGATGPISDALAQAAEADRGGKRSSQQGQPEDSKEGISSGPVESGPLPAAIRDLGLSADQWAKLPPMARKDLLNAARQTGPAAYRQMIKDYYSRLAEMRND